MTDILITCPPMLKSMDKFRGKLKDLGFRANCPNVVQTLSERELIDLVPKYEGWIIGDDPATMKVLEAGINGRLRALVKWGIGVDNIDLEATKNLGLKFSNTPMMFGAEVADLALSYIISLSRETYQIHCEVKAGKWIKPRGISLKGRTLGIVGLGDIGRNLAKRSQACELNIIGYDPYVSQSALDPKIKKKEWPDHIEQIDFLVFTCALSSKNFHMFNEQTLSKVKHGVRIVNVARGGLIDEKALISGLENGSIHSAALDVFEIEPLPMDAKLRNFSQVIFGSHNASNTEEAVLKTSETSLVKIFEFLKDTR